MISDIIVFSQVPLSIPLRMFEVFTACNLTEASINCIDALTVTGGTFLYLVERGKLSKIVLIVVCPCDDILRIFCVTLLLVPWVS